MGDANAAHMQPKHRQCNQHTDYASAAKVQSRAAANKCSGLSDQTQDTSIFGDRDTEVAVGMRLVLQRVSQASVTISGECVAAIGSGVLVLVGIGHHDSDTDIQWAVKRILDTQVMHHSPAAGFEEC